MKQGGTKANLRPGLESVLHPSKRQPRIMRRVHGREETTNTRLTAKVLDLVQGRGPRRVASQPLLAGFEKVLRPAIIEVLGGSSGFIEPNVTPPPSRCSALAGRAITASWAKGTGTIGRKIKRRAPARRHAGRSCTSPKGAEASRVDPQDLLSGRSRNPEGAIRRHVPKWIAAS
jgi:hypothetical protein